MTLILLLAALVFNLLAQSFLKTAVTGIRFDSFSLSFLLKIFGSPMIWVGGFFYGLSFLFYIMALSRGELSRISPVSQALTTLGIVLISVLLFNEPITMMKIIGVVLLIVGTLVMFL
jgi:uncharacterized membrane protein